MLRRLWSFPSVRGFLRLLVWSRLALFGAALALIGGTLLAALLIAEWLGFESGPYVGILNLLILPGILALGLLLIPVGVLRARRRQSESGADAAPAAYPVLDFNLPRLRRNLLAFLLLTFCNTFLLGLASYRGVEYMESPAFCGKTCHTVMGPEFAAYQSSPHARVDCVRCHVGPGAPGFVRSKLSGVRQLLAFARGSYHRPIPTPVKSLRPARETCEACHWQQAQHGDRLRILTHYDDDETSTEQKTVLLLHVGGGEPPRGAGRGIHWHMNLANEVTYIAADDERSRIPWVRFRDSSGTITEFSASDIRLTPREIDRAPKRKMDCIDCHNRPAHRFQLPEEAVDETILLQKLDRGLPFLKRRMVEALKAPYADRNEARLKIGESLERIYGASGSGSGGKSLGAVVAATREIYARNVFPEMGVTWGAHPDQIGHERFPGCFRCHDGEHKSSDGREITQDCEACHAVLAVAETDPAVLKTLSGQP